MIYQTACDLVLAGWWMLHLETLFTVFDKVEVEGFKQSVIYFSVQYLTLVELSSLRSQTFFSDLRCGGVRRVGFC